jgi:hypothetical protein
MCRLQLQVSKFCLGPKDGLTNAHKVENMLLAMPEPGAHDIFPKRSTILSEITSQDLCMLAGPAASDFSREDVSSWNEENVCMVFLHLNYERFVTLHHRMDEIVLKASSPGAWTTSDGHGNGRSATDVQLSRTKALDEVRANISSSAKRSVRLFEDLLAQDLLRYSPSFL